MVIPIRVPPGSPRHYGEAQHRQKLRRKVIYFIGTLICCGLLSSFIRRSLSSGSLKTQLTLSNFFDVEDRTFVEQLADVHSRFPANLCAKHLTPEVYMKLVSLNSGSGSQATVRDRVRKCARSGLLLPKSVVGAYAVGASDYHDLAAFFEPLIFDYHGGKPGDIHHSAPDWSSHQAEETFPGGEALSVRIRVARNIAGFPLVASIEKSERVLLEACFLAALHGVANGPAIEFSDHHYVTLTPQVHHRERRIAEVISGVSVEYVTTAARHIELLKERAIFQNMSTDPYLVAAGIASDWPIGRGSFTAQGPDGVRIVVWWGEEDHLRLTAVCARCRSVAPPATVLQRFIKALEPHLVEKIGIVKHRVFEDVFARSSRYGFISSCPSNLGTGMRASAHVHLPGLAARWSELTAFGDKLGVAIRGAGGEHTAVGPNGLVDISPKRRLFVSEDAIVDQLAGAIHAFGNMEKNAQRDH